MTRSCAITRGAPDLNDIKIAPEFAWNRKRNRDYIPVSLPGFSLTIPDS